MNQEKGRDMRFRVSAIGLGGFTFLFGCFTQPKLNRIADSQNVGIVQVQSEGDIIFRGHITFQSFNLGLSCRHIKAPFESFLLGERWKRWRPCRVLLFRLPIEKIQRARGSFTIARAMTKEFTDSIWIPLH